MAFATHQYAVEPLSKVAPLTIVKSLRPHFITLVHDSKFERQDEGNDCPR